MPKLPEFYIGCTKILNPDSNTVAPFSAAGVTVHYTASGDFDSAYEALLSKGLNYHIIIDRNGEPIQTAKLTKSVYHAGKALWGGLSPNSHHVAVAVVCWGQVTKGGTTWNGEKVPLSEVRDRDGHFWHTATMAQEKSLLECLKWLVTQGIAPKNVCGHHECCIPLGRKIDPGGSLIWTMHELRQLLSFR